MIRPVLSLDRLSFLEQEGKVGYRWGRDDALKIRVGDLLLFPGPELGEEGLDVRGSAHDDEDVVVCGEERRGRFAGPGRAHGSDPGQVLAVVIEAQLVEGQPDISWASITTASTWPESEP